MPKCKPCKYLKNPRYLKPQVCRETWIQDLKYYNYHLWKMCNMKPYVDSKPLKMDPRWYLDYKKLHDDLERANIIDQENAAIMRKILTIQRKGGEVNTINPLANFSNSHWLSHVRRMNRIDFLNTFVYKLIVESKSNYCKAEYDRLWVQTLIFLARSARFPLVVFQKSSLDDALRAEPTISGFLDKLGERPLCFLEFQVVDGEYLGRIVVELYYDHVPVTVQNFLSICKGENDLTYKNCNIHRIVKNKFIETGDITRGTGTGGFSIYGETFDEENHMLKHSKTGVLSMVRTRDQKNNSKFCITLICMEQFDKKNVVFGKVIKGAHVLQKINGYARHIGKPLRTIVISNCGEYGRECCHCDSYNENG